MGYREKIPEGQYLSGLEEAAQKLQDYIDKMADAGSQGLVDAALYILGEAAERAPVDTGNLRGSGYVDLDGQRTFEFDQPLISKKEARSGMSPAPGSVVPVSTTPEGVTHTEIGFDAPYAADQHEQVHLTHPKGGQAKYLESVLVEEQSRIINTIAGKMQEAMDDA